MKTSPSVKLGHIFAHQSGTKTARACFDDILLRSRQQQRKHAVGCYTKREENAALRTVRAPLSERSRPTSGTVHAICKSAPGTSSMSRFDMSSERWGCELGRRFIGPNLDLNFDEAIETHCSAVFETLYYCGPEVSACLSAAQEA